MQANTKQARALLRIAVQRSIANFAQNVNILRILTEPSRARNACANVRYMMVILEAQRSAQLYDVLDFAQYLFANEGNNFDNKITLTGLCERNGRATAYLRIVTHLAD